MTHNALSRSMNTLPMWVLQTLLGLLLAGALSWATWTTKSSMAQQTKLAVAETKVDALKSDIGEIKDVQKEMNHKLDWLIKRRPGR
jgi:hypothetical protein